MINTSIRHGSWVKQSYYDANHTAGKLSPQDSHSRTHDMLDEVDKGEERRRLCQRFVDKTMPFFEIHAQEIKKRAMGGDVVAHTLIALWEKCIGVEWAMLPCEVTGEPIQIPNYRSMTSSDEKMLRDFDNAVRKYVRQCKYGQTFMYHELTLRERKKILKRKLQQKGK